MTKKVIAMLRDQRGALVLSTAQESVANCERYCEDHIINFDDKKDAGAKVVQVELRELPAEDTLANVREAAKRVANYVKERGAARGLDQVEVATMNAGSDREANLYMADLQLLASFAANL